jgi:acyl carrier protein
VRRDFAILPAVPPRGDRQKLLEIVREALDPLVAPGARRKIVASASLLHDLGMDSLRVVELTLRLETLLKRPVFLPEWIASVDDPADLTVGSLVDFLSRDR